MNKKLLVSSLVLSMLFLACGQEEKKIEILYDFIADLSSEIDKVEDVVERALLRYRYITCLTWEQIAEKMGYCLSQVYRIHNRAFKNFNKINDTK